jgi:hypothetical protein
MGTLKITGKKYKNYSTLKIIPSFLFVCFVFCGTGAYTLSHSTSPFL